MSQDFHSWLYQLPKETFCNEQLISTGSTARRQALFRDDLCTDLVLQCQGRSINCHRFILMEQSDVFLTMLTSKFVEGSAGSVEIGNINSDLLSKIITFLYDGQMTIEGPDIIELFEFSDMYDVTPLRDVCHKMWLNHMTPTVAMEIWQYAKRYHDSLLEIDTAAFCIEHFTNSDRQPLISQTYGFLEADDEMIRELLGHSELNVPDENAVFNALYDWLMYKKESRAQYTERLFTECIHAHNLDSQACRDKETQCGKDAEDQETLSLFGFSENVKVTGLLAPRTRTRMIDTLAVFMQETDSWSQTVIVNHGVQQVTQWYKSRLVTHHSDGRWWEECFDDPIAICKLYQSTRDLYCVTLSGLLYRQQRNQLGNKQWVRTTLRRSLEYCHLLFTPSAKIYKIDVSEGFCIARVQSEETWRVEQSWNCPGLEVTNIELSAYYRGYVIILEPHKNWAHVLDTRAGHFNTHIDIPLGNDQSCIDVVTKGNLCFLVADRHIRMIYMDRLLDKEAKVAQKTDARDGTDQGQSSQESNEAVPSSISNNIVKTFNIPRYHTVICNCVIYQQKLYILEKTHEFDGSSRMLVNSTDVNQLLDSDSEPHWVREMEEYSRDGVYNRFDFKCQLLCTRMRNPLV